MAWIILRDLECARGALQWPRSQHEEFAKVRRLLRAYGPTAFGGVVWSKGLGVIVVEAQGGYFRLGLEIVQPDTMIIRTAEFFETPDWP